MALCTQCGGYAGIGRTVCAACADASLVAKPEVSSPPVPTPAPDHAPPSAAGITPREESTWVVDSSSESAPAPASTPPASRARVCPFCGEEVKVQAKKCRHCRRWFEDTDGLAVLSPPVLPPVPRPTPVPAPAPAAEASPGVPRDASSPLRLRVARQPRTSPLVPLLFIAVLVLALLVNGRRAGWFQSTAVRASAPAPAPETVTVVRSSYELVTAAISSGAVLSDTSLALLSESELRRAEALVLSRFPRSSADSANLATVRRVGRTSGIVWAADSPDSLCVSVSSPFACGRLLEGLLLERPDLGLRREGSVLVVPLLNGEVISVSDEVDGTPPRTVSAVEFLPASRQLSLVIHELDVERWILMSLVDGTQIASPGRPVSSPGGAWIAGITGVLETPRFVVWRVTPERLEVAFDSGPLQGLDWAPSRLEWVDESRLVVQRERTKTREAVAPVELLVRDGRWAFVEFPAADGEAPGQPAKGEAFANADYPATGGRRWLEVQRPVPTFVDRFVYSLLGPVDHETPRLIDGYVYRVRISGRGGVGPLDGTNNSLSDAAFGHVNFQNLDVARTDGDGFGVAAWDNIRGRRPYPDRYSTEHVYDYFILGTGRTLRFAYRDNPYYDNTGGFFVEITQLGPIAP